MANPEAPKTIVYINSGAIGEFLMTIFFFNKIHEVAPDTDLMVVVPRNKNLLENLLGNYPWIRVVEFEKKGMFGVIASIARSTRIPSLIITQQTFGKTPVRIKFFAYVIARLTRGEVAGFDDGALSNRFFYDTLITFVKEKPFSEMLLSFARQLGFPVLNGAPSLCVAHGERTTSSGIVIAPFAANEKRSLPVKRWIGLSVELGQKYPNIPLTVLGAPRDQEAARRIAAGHPLGKEYTSAPFSETVERIRDAQVFIGIDSGLTHVAGVMQVPSVIIENNSNPTWWPDYNKNAIILVEKEECTCDGAKGGNCTEYIGTKPYYRCMVNVKDGDVLANVESILSEN